MPSASSRKRRLRPLPHWTVFTSDSLRMSIATSWLGGLSLGWPRSSQLGSRSQLDEQSLEILDDVAAAGQRVRDAGDTCAAHDRRVGADGSEGLDVALGLDAEADGDRHVRAVAQGREDRRQRAVIGWPDRPALAVRRHEVNVSRAV